MGILETVINMGKDYIEEKKRQEQEQIEARRKLEEEMFHQQCKKAFLEALKDDISNIYNTKYPLALVSLHAETCNDGMVRMKLPKQNSSHVLRRLQSIELKKELQQRLNSVQAEARRVMLDLMKQQQIEREILLNKVAYDYNHASVRELEYSMMQDWQNQLRQLSSQLWTYKIMGVEDSVDSLYIEILFTVNTAISF